MMKKKGKVVVEELVVSNKFARNHLTSKAKEFYKMLQSIKMEPIEHKWAKQAGLERLLNIQWIIPRFIEGVFANLRAIKDGRI